MDKVYVLFYDADTDAPEAWLPWYIPGLEVFSTQEDAEARVEYLKQRYNKAWQAGNYSAHIEEASYNPPITSDPEDETLSESNEEELNS